MIIIMFLEKWQLYYQCLRPTVCRAVKTKTSSSFPFVNQARRRLGSTSINTKRQPSHI